MLLTHMCTVTVFLSFGSQLSGNSNGSADSALRFSSEFHASGV
jgi:hypothetical protein